MRVIIDRRLALAERSATVLVRDAELWTYGAQSRRLVRYSGMATKELRIAEPLPPVSIQDGALAWDGSHLLVGDRSSRRVFRVDAASGRETLLMDPSAIVCGEFDPALKVVDAALGDISWQDGTLIVAIQAGYSSAIYTIDPAKKRVVSHRLAPGPKPVGVEVDPGDGALYVADGRNLELRRFSVNGRMDVADLSAEVAEPRGLAIDSDRGLWTVDWSTNSVLRIRVEG